MAKGSVLTLQAHRAADEVFIFFIVNHKCLVTHLLISGWASTDQLIYINLPGLITIMQLFFISQFFGLVRAIALLHY
jgi:hypothetical protein